MSKPFSPKFVTETDEPSPWTDCTWASGLMLANKASLGAYPATRAEREALRKASGDHFGGSNLTNLHDGIHVRYHWTLATNGVSWHGLLTRLARGDGAIVQGLYSELSNYYTRWDQNFANKGSLSRHACYVQGHDRGGNYHLAADGLPKDVFWCDPLGRSPKGTPPAKRYRGEWMPAGQLHAFLNGLAGDADLLAASVENGEQA